MSQNYPLQACPHASDTSDLIERAKRDPEAFASLYDHYHLPLFRYFYSKVNNPSDAEDLTSQVFLTVLESLPRYQGKGSFVAWLFGIARRKTADYYRKRIAVIPFESAAEVAAPGISMLAQIVHSEQLKLLAKRVGELDQEEQELLRLRFAAGLSFMEIAELLHKKESAVKMALYRLLERLEAQMEVDPHA